MLANSQSLLTLSEAVYFVPQMFYRGNDELFNKRLNDCEGGGDVVENGTKRGCAKASLKDAGMAFLPSPPRNNCMYPPVTAVGGLGKIASGYLSIFET